MQIPVLYLFIGGIVMLVVGILIGRLRKASTDTSFLSNIFQSNQDFDTTLGLFGVNCIILIMLVCFHDDVKDDIGMIFLAAFNLYQTIVLRKPAGIDHGKTPPSTNN